MKTLIFFLYLVYIVLQISKRDKSDKDRNSHKSSNRDSKNFASGTSNKSASNDATVKSPSVASAASSHERRDNLQGPSVSPVTDKKPMSQMLTQRWNSI